MLLVIKGQWKINGLLAKFTPKVMNFSLRWGKVAGGRGGKKLLGDCFLRQKLTQTQSIFTQEFD